MADNFRTFRRDGRDGDVAQGDGVSDPLAELARLIGQNEAHGNRGPDDAQPLEGGDAGASASGLDWAADEVYAQHASEAEESYAPPRYAPPAAGFQDVRLDETYHEEPQSAASRGQPLQYIPPAHSSYRADEQVQDDAPAYPETVNDVGHEYDEDAAPRRPRGTVVVLAVLGLIVVGTAGALGYRAMFGGSVIPSLPPIIAPGNTPIKIVPKHDSQAGAPSQADAGANGTGEHLVTHEEQPVNVQSANPVPRVVTTIPIIPNTPDGSFPGEPPGSPPQMVPAAPVGTAASAAPSGPAAAMPGSAQSNNRAEPVGATDQLTSPAPPPSGSKPVRTVIIRTDQPPAARPAASAPQPAHSEKVRQAAAKPNTAAAPRTASAGPLSIVPTQEGGARPLPPPPRTHTAMTRSPAPASSSSTAPPAEEVSSGGAYAVQVSSQRSEAEAQAAFRSLQAKYPQLRDRQPIIRRADLGAKGIYYRALVGPFASTEQAGSLCSSLKAAGGSCLIQRN
jgi:hypothetical protein